MLAIHLNRDLSTKFEWNNESHLKAVLATSHFHSLSEDKSELTNLDKVWIISIYLRN
jgi:aspartyl aminopeptidase